MGNLDTVEDVKIALEGSKKEFATLRRHFERVEELYSDLEDKIVLLEKKLYEIENDIAGDDTKLLEKISSLEAHNEKLIKDLKQLTKAKKEPSIAEMFND